MEFINNEFSFPSAGGTCDIFAKSSAPKNIEEIKAVVQIAHGMAEHIDRYEYFIKYLNTRGCAVFISDHAGHGKSVKSEADLGYFGEKDGDKTLVEDVKSLTDIAVKAYPDFPVILFGHSMGSFVARSYAAKYGDLLRGAVFCGTAGANPAAGAGIAVANLTAKSKGSHYRSEFIDKLAFGAYNKKYKPARTKFDWLTNDEAVVDAYIGDRLCGFLFTAAAYRDMFTLLKGVSGSAWYKKVPKELNMFLVAGKDDPVGAYGKGVTQVYDKLRA
ncbi:MAG: lysophospholipase, partial [Oscillospiraceae bacterium]|nr:lysophospholipase [Oscillospiraceae bacterium]